MPEAVIRDATPAGIAAAARDLSEAGLALVLARIDDVSWTPSLTSGFNGSSAFAWDDRSPAARGWQQRRLIARSILRQALNLPDEAIRLVTRTGGAPGIVLPAGLRKFLSFSARGDLALIGIADAPLGVDIEEPLSADAIPVNMLRADERDALFRLEPEKRAAAFQQLWTLKEAFLKAIGTGLAVPPEAVVIDDSAGGIRLSLEQGGNRRAVSAKVLTWPPVPGLKSDQRGEGLQGGRGLAVAAVILS